MAPLSDNTKHAKKFEEKLGEFRLEEAEDLAKILSEKYGIPYQDLSITPINTDALRLIPEEKAREVNIAPFRLTGKNLHIATTTPGKEPTKMAIRGFEEQGYAPKIYIVSARSLERAWERYKEISYAAETRAGVVEIVSEQILSFAKKLSTIGDVKKIVEETLAGKQRYATTRLLEILLAGAIAVDASDIHVEPEEDTIRLRYRLDGVLQDILAFDRKTYTLLLSRVKLVAGLKLNIKDDAQDGRFSIKLGETDVEVRTSTLPGAYGESIVMRILNPKTILVPFEELGIEPYLLQILEHEIRRPNGMILNTGPTGSGKTTTLYAILRKVKTPKIKIITIEDPIEYHLPGISQTQVEEDKGYTFLQGLRSSLRQDPDVIMVGEVRDEETAKTAIHAALTGHLVLSTLHTNNAAGAVPRLIDLGVNPKIISSAVNIAVAQRLVRRLCASCKKEEKPAKEEEGVIKKILQTIPEKRRGGVGALLIWRAVGCEKCNNTGYKGRIGIFEAVIIDDTVDKVIQANPSEHDIKQAAESQELLDMRQDGILKVLLGVTTLEELARVVEL